MGFGGGQTQTSHLEMLRASEVVQHVLANEKRASLCDLYSVSLRSAGHGSRDSDGASDVTTPEHTSHRPCRLGNASTMAAISKLEYNGLCGLWSRALQHNMNSAKAARATHSRSLFLHPHLHPSPHLRKSPSHG